MLSGLDAWVIYDENPRTVVELALCNKAVILIIGVLGAMREAFELDQLPDSRHHRVSKGYAIGYLMDLCPINRRLNNSLR